jgi:hypothetical protein
VNANAARRARRKAIQADLTKAYTDEEAAPPEWLDLLNTVRDEAAAIRTDVQSETARFVAESDIRAALARRDRVAQTMRERIEALNRTIRRLNLIAPHARFTRAALNTDEILRPLFRSARSR